MHILVQLMVLPHVYEAMFIFLYFFNFCFSNKIHFIGISSVKFIVSFFCLPKSAIEYL